MSWLERIREIEKRFEEDEIDDSDIIWMINVIKDALGTQNRLSDLVRKDK